MAKPISTLQANQRRFDQLIEQQSELTAELQETAAFNKLEEVKMELVQLTEALKSVVKEKGDFTTKYYRFQMYDRRSVDYKGMMDRLVKDKKATPKYLSQFVRVQSVVQAAPLTSSKDDE